MASRRGGPLLGEPFGLELFWAEPFGTTSKITSVFDRLLDSELWTKKPYDHGNLYCSEIVIIVNQIKLFKLNSLIHASLLFWSS